MITTGVHHGDCLDVMQNISDTSVDMILCDLPYGLTSCSWDSVIPLEPLWKEYTRIAKPNAAIVLTASQPFTGVLVTSNLKMFRHSWVYQKRCASNFAQAKFSPMKEHEDVLVFSKNKALFYPIKEQRKGGGLSRSKYQFTGASCNPGEFVDFMGGGTQKYIPPSIPELRYPSSVQEFNNRATGDIGLHPTQKPVALFEYLIKTYTKEGDLVLDNCAGSGTTGIACLRNKREFILIEKELNFVEVIQKRLSSEPSLKQATERE